MEELWISRNCNSVTIMILFSLTGALNVHLNGETLNCGATTWSPKVLVNRIEERKEADSKLDPAFVTEREQLRTASIQYIRSVALAKQKPKPKMLIPPRCSLKSVRVLFHDVNSYVSHQWEIDKDLNYESDDSKPTEKRTTDNSLKRLDSVINKFLRIQELNRMRKIIHRGNPAGNDLKREVNSMFNREMVRYTRLIEPREIKQRRLKLVSMAKKRRKLEETPEQREERLTKKRALVHRSRARKRAMIQSSSGSEGVKKKEVENKGNVSKGKSKKPRQNYESDDDFVSTAQVPNAVSTRLRSNDLRSRLRSRTRPNTT